MCQYPDAADQNMPFHADLDPNPDPDPRPCFFLFLPEIWTRRPLSLSVVSAPTNNNLVTSRNKQQSRVG
jgi:hypothetical protein